MLVRIPAVGWVILVRIPARRWVILVRIPPPRVGHAGENTWVMLVGNDRCSKDWSPCKCELAPDDQVPGRFRHRDGKQHQDHESEHESTSLIRHRLLPQKQD